MDPPNTTRSLFVGIAHAAEAKSIMEDPGTSNCIGGGTTRFKKRVSFGQRVTVAVYKETEKHVSPPPSPSTTPLPSGFLDETYTLFDQMREKEKVGERLCGSPTLDNLDVDDLDEDEENMFATRIIDKQEPKQQEQQSESLKDGSEPMILEDFTTHIIKKHEPQQPEQQSESLKDGSEQMMLEDFTTRIIKKQVQQQSEQQSESLKDCTEQMMLEDFTLHEDSFVLKLNDTSLSEKSTATYIIDNKQQPPQQSESLEDFSESLKDCLEPSEPQKEFPEPMEGYSEPPKDYLEPFKDCSEPSEPQKEFPEPMEDYLEPSEPPKDCLEPLKDCSELPEDSALDKTISQMDDDAFENWFIQEVEPLEDQYAAALENYLAKKRRFDELKKEKTALIGKLEGRIKHYRSTAGAENVTTFVQEKIATIYPGGL